MGAPEEKTSVLIVGGGPVGLIASILLGSFGISSILVERREDVTDHPRSRAVTIRSCEIFRSLGIFDALREVSLPEAWTRQIIYATTLAGPELGRMHASGWDQATRGPLTPVSALMSSQDRIEPVLRGSAEREAASTLRFHHELTGLEITGDGVRATIRDRGGSRDSIVHARYVIGADGASSPVREMLGIGLEGPRNIAHLMNVYYRADLDPWVRDRPAALYFVASGEAAGVFQPLDGRGRWLCQIQYDPSKDPTESFTPDRCIEWIRSAVGNPDVPIEVLKVRPWALAAALAERFREGPVFLAGDAAHLLPPTGGFGMNTGIQDAHNLAWKIAGVLHGWAGPELLETYDRERRPVVRYNIDRSLENFLKVAEIGAAARAAARRGTTDAASDPAAVVRSSRRYGNFLGLDLGFSYEEGAVIPDGTSPPRPPDPVEDYLPCGRPGHRAPHAVLVRGGREISTLDLFGRAFTLLAGADGGDWVAAASGSKRRVPLEAFRIAPDGDLVDPAGEWPKLYGVSASGAVLVRPDGHVAWRSADRAGDPAAALAGALDRLTGNASHT